MSLYEWWSDSSSWPPSPCGTLDHIGLCSMELVTYVSSLCWGHILVEYNKQHGSHAMVISSKHVDFCMAINHKHLYKPVYKILYAFFRNWNCEWMEWRCMTTHMKTDISLMFKKIKVLWSYLQYKINLIIIVGMFGYTSASSEATLWTFILVMKLEVLFTEFVKISTYFLHKYYWSRCFKFSVCVL